MKKLDRFYIDGEWQSIKNTQFIDIINPANKECVGSLSMGNEEHVNKAVHAAKKAFKTYAFSSKEERLSLLDKILFFYKSRYEEFAEAITIEMGAPMFLSKEAQAFSGIEHFEAAIEALKTFDEIQSCDGFDLYHEPIGVCGLITPWNWPINQIACKVAPAIATGCTVILKPSEFAPLSAQLFAEIMDEAGTPKGVFNMVYGDGINVGAPLSSHPDVDMVSFTGSTQAGIAVAKSAADTVKRISQELGGKSPIILTEDCDLKEVLSKVAWLCMENTGQSCNAGTRLIVPSSIHDDVVISIKEIVDNYKVGNPLDEATEIGPLANENQYRKVKSLLERASKEGLEPVCGGLRAMNQNKTGYFVPPTIFAGLKNDDLIAREEIFGPVLAVIPYETLEGAINIANDSLYGLSAYIYSGNNGVSSQLVKSIRAGMVHVNGAPLSPHAPFGGYKQSGNGREWGMSGLHEFYEIKAVMA